MDLNAKLSELRQSGNFRSIPQVGLGGECVDLSTNDYLGIAADNSLLASFWADDSRRGLPLSASASRLLAARQEEFFKLEQRLSQLYGGRGVLLFNSGYHANTGLVSALASSAKTMVLADRLVHASIIDGIVLSKAPFSRFRHNDYNHLERLIARNVDDYDVLLVIVEGVYSMDGDSADIASLVSLKRRYPKVALYVDEAHSFGVKGPNGLGLVEQWRRGDAASSIDDVDVVVGTFGKAAGSVGAFCVTSPAMKDYAVNRSRSFIFSTALPPLCAEWTLFVVDRMVDMDDRRAHLAALASALRDQLAGFGDEPLKPSHIMPLVIGDPHRVVKLSAKLLDRGFKVLPIRTPTVPPSTERLRFSLSAALSLDDIACLGGQLREVME